MPSGGRTHLPGGVFDRATAEEKRSSQSQFGDSTGIVVVVTVVVGASIVVVELTG